MRRYLPALFLVVVTSTLSGAFFGALTLVLMLPVFPFTGILVQILIGLLFILFVAAPIMAQQFITVFIVSPIGTLLLSIMAIAIIWYVSQSIIGWSMANYGVGVLSIRGYRLLQSIPIIGLGAGWIIALITFFQTYFYVPKRKRR